MALYNQSILEKVMADYRSGQSIDGIIDYLEKETKKPLGKSKINLNSLEVNQPNVIPWNNLGLKLLRDRDYHSSEKVWRKMIELAYELAPLRYSNIPPVGLPFNNLALTLQAQGKHNDAFIALSEAYSHDIKIGNPSPVARSNFLSMFNQVLSQFLPITEIINKSEEKENNAKDYEFNAKPTIKGQNILIWFSFLIPTLVGVVLLFYYPNNWYFLFLIGIGILSPYFHKDVVFKILGNIISVKNPPLQERNEKNK